MDKVLILLINWLIKKERTHIPQKGDWIYHYHWDDKLVVGMAVVLRAVVNHNGAVFLEVKTAKGETYWVDNYYCAKLLYE